MRNHRDPTRSKDAVSEFRRMGYRRTRNAEIVGEAARSTFGGGRMEGWKDALFHPPFRSSILPLLRPLPAGQCQSAQSVVSNPDGGF